MESMARAGVSSSAQLRPCCPRLRRSRNRSIPRHPSSRHGRRAVACSAAGADVVDLFDAAKLTVDRFVKSGMVVGLGSGPASGLAIQYLGTRLRRGSLTGIVGITSSVFSASEADKAGIPVSSYQEGTQIDVAFTDADVIEEGTLAAVIGRRKIESGEPSFMEEKAMAKSADKLAFITGNDKYVKGVEGSIPVLVKSGNWIDTAEEIDDLFLGDAEVWRRPSFGTAGPLGGDHPLVTKEGHHILDVIFTTPIPNLGQVAEGLDKIAGVVDHGIIAGIRSYAVISSKGEVQVLDEESSVIL
ncbi:probable ribose-5-phosphate isomerase 4, chloroplastic [Phragmites australis]|uniref:probable ribose-5-phosphate isomerase 4, chloroplastic n=1 Tax=Phragmites australis TaxID=29695 RepID=UPI002D768119|nr:probable ribose-5-phosphate isomerase 4, chloroplastic [Phragmites australis]